MGRTLSKQKTLICLKINNSISFDFKLVDEDIRLNKVYADSLCRGKIISVNENKNPKALDEILIEVKKKFKFSDHYEDIHMNVEMLLKKIVTCQENSHWKIQK